MKLQISYQIIISILALTIGTAIMLGFVAVPSSQDILALGEQISVTQTRMSKTIARGLQFRDIAQNAEMIKKDLPRLRSMLIAPGKEVDFFTTLEQKNRTHDLDQLVRLGTSKSLTPAIQELSLTFELRGEFANIMAYLNDLERAPEQISIRKIVIHRAAATAPSVAIGEVPRSATQKPLIATIEGSIYVGTP